MMRRKFILFGLMILISGSLVNFNFSSIPNEPNFQYNQMNSKFIGGDKHTIWSQNYGDEGFENCFASAFDSNETIFLAGVTQSSETNEKNMILLKYDKEGNLLKDKILGKSGNEEICYDILIDGEDNILITGTIRKGGSNMGDIFLGKYDQYLRSKWNLTWGNPSIDEIGKAIAIDSSNNIYIAGNSESDTILVKFDQDGQDIWDKSWGGNKDEICNSVIIDNSNNIYLAGSTTSFGDFEQSIYLLKFNIAGDLIWEDIWSEYHGHSCQDLALDSDQNIFLIGESNQRRIRILKYSPSGNLLWTKRWGKNTNNEGYCVVIDSEDNLYIAGITAHGEVDNQKDIILLIINSRGEELQNFTIGTLNSEYCHDILLDSSGYLYLSGFSHNLETGNEDIIILKITLNPQSNSVVFNLDFFLPAILFLIAIIISILLYKIRKPIITKIQWGFNQITLNEEEMANEVKKTIFSMEKKYNRILIKEIMEQSGIYDKETILKAIRDMIKDRELNFIFFSSTKYIVFDKKGSTPFNKDLFLEKFGTLTQRGFTEKNVYVKEILSFLEKRFYRIFISEIKEITRIKEDTLINAIKDLIDKNEFHAEFIEETQSIVFDRTKETEKFDEVIKRSKKSEERGKEKKLS
jgi:hypothetical protein